MSANESGGRQSIRSLGDLAAVKTSIANGDVDEVKARLHGKSVDKLEKGYLLDLARLSGNDEIEQVIKNTPAN